MRHPSRANAATHKPPEMLNRPAPIPAAANGAKCRTPAPLHFRAKAAALREGRQSNISDDSVRTGKQRKEIQKPWVFGGVLSPISSAVGRNGAAGGIKQHLMSRRGQKWVAPQRETSLPRQQARKNHRGGAVHQLAVRKAVPLKKQPVRRTDCFLHHARGEGTNSRFRSACVGIPSSAALSLYCHMSKA